MRIRIVTRWPCEIEIEKRADGWRVVARGFAVIPVAVALGVAGVAFYYAL